MSSSEESAVALTDEQQDLDLLQGRKVNYSADITDVGPCRKKIQVTIPQSEIEVQLEDSLGDLRKEAQVPGFRPGRVPRVLIQRRFKKEVGDRVKSSLMMSSLEQIEKDHKLNLISQPQIDFSQIELPDSGPMTFELEIEVRPTFESPSLDNMVVKRPVRELSEADVERQYKSFLERYADVVPKDGEAQLGDLISADLVFSRDGKEVNTASDIQFRVQPELRFQDGRVPDCGKALEGVKAGESRTTKAKVGTSSADPNLRGQEIDVTFHVKDVKFLRLPEVDDLFLARIGFDTEEELKSALKEVLQNRLESNQRQAVRNDLMNQLIDAVPFELPRDLVNRQTRDTLRKRVMDLRESGLSEAQIRASESELRANAYESTVRGLKEYFILDKIASDNDLKVEQEDIDLEIARIADREDSTPRRVRARLERENSMDFLAIQIIENKTIDFILDKVKIEDFTMDEESEVETLDETATPGGLADPELESSGNSDSTES
ncbi:MAG: hypothetical protein RJA81_151 [Planctomycetota bacterium]|jgi:trigger factor